MGSDRPLKFMDEIIRLFVVSCDMSNPAREEAEDRIVDMIDSDTVSMISLTSQVILKEDLPLEVVRKALEVIFVCFDRDNIPKRVIRDAWMQVNREVKTELHSALLKRIGSTDRTTADMASRNMAKILECGDLEILEKLYSNMRNDVGNNEMPCNYRIALVKSACCVLDLASSFFQNPELDIFIEPVLRVLTPATEIELSKELFKYFGVLTRKLYFMEQFELTPIGMKMVDILNGENMVFACQAMKFWFDLAKFESHQKRMCDIESAMEKAFLRDRRESLRHGTRGHVFRNMCNLVVSETERLLNILLMIDETDQDAEEVEVELKPHMYATQLLREVFKLSPDTIFNKVSEFWRKSLETEGFIEGTWVNVHSLMLALSVVMDEKNHSRQIDNFVKQTRVGQMGVPLMKFIMEYVNSDVPILVDTALYTLSKIVRVYNSDMELFGPLIQYMINLVRKNPAHVIIERVYCMIKAIVNQNSGLFDGLIDIPLFVLQRPDIYKGQLLEKSYYVIGRLIKNASVSFTKELLTSTISELEEMTTDDLTPEQSRLQQCKLEIVEHCYHRFGHKLEIRMLAKRTSDVIFQFLRNKHNNSCLNESLVTLVLVLRSLGDDALEIYNGEEMYALIEAALEERNEQILMTSLIVFAEFCATECQTITRECRQDLIEKLHAIIEMTVRSLHSDLYTHKFKNEVLIGMSSVLDKAGKYIPRDYGIELKDIYASRAKDITFDMASEADIENANRMFEAIFRALGAITRIVGNTCDRTLMRSIIIGPVEAYSKLPYYSVRSIEQYCNYLTEFNNVFGRHGSVLLNRRVNCICCYRAKAQLEIDGHECAKYVRSIIEKMPKS